MKRRISAQALIDNRLLAAMVVVLVVNTLVVGAGFFFFSRPGENNAGADSKEIVIQEIISYNQQMAGELGVNDRTPVKQAIADFQYEMQLTNSSKDLYRVILTRGPRVQETILQEREAMLKDRIILLLNQDAKITSTDEQTIFILTVSKQEGVTTEPDSFIAPETGEAIMALLEANEFEQTRTFDIEVEAGQAKIKTPWDPMEAIRNLEQEVTQLRQTLLQVQQEAGYAEMSGTGVVIKIYDAENGYTESTIVHESDVRQVVNDLFTAGARGIAIGDQRLITTSNITCPGPVIYVNNNPVAVDPVTIKAVGDPQVLASSMEIMKAHLAAYRGLRMEVEQQDYVTLPAYKKR